MPKRFTFTLEGVSVVSFRFAPVRKLSLCCVNTFTWATARIAIGSRQVRTAVKMRKKKQLDEESLRKLGSIHLWILFHAASLSRLREIRSIGIARRAINRFDEGDAATAFPTVADGRGVLLNGAKKILEHGLMSANVADHRGSGAEIVVAGTICGDVCRSFAKIRGNDAILFQNDGSLRAGNFQAARIAGVSGRGCMEDAQRAVGKFQDGRDRVLGFDGVQR